MLRFVTLCIVVSGCLDSRSGRRAGELDASDTTQSDVAVETSPACQHASLMLVEEGVELAEGSDYSNPVVLDGTSLYAAVATLGPTGYGRHNVQVMDLETGTSYGIADPDTNHYVIDARDGVLLFGAMGAGTIELRYHDVSSGTTQVLERYEVDSTLRLTTNQYYWGRVARLVERGVAAWAESGYEQGKTRTRVKLWSGGQTRVLYDGFTPSLALELYGDAVAWSVLGDSPAVWLARGGQEPTQIATGSVYELALNDQSLFWLDDQGIVWRYDFADGSRRSLGDERCAGLIAQGPRAAAVCGGEQPETSWLVGTPGRPTVFEGERRITIPSTEGLTIAGLELYGNRLAWVEYPPEVGCRNQFEPGSLRGVSLLAPDAPRELAPVRSGCWCCDAYWPALQISLSERGVAWNYPMIDGPEDYPAAASVGWALFEDCK